MRINKFVSIPEFIKAYIDKEESGLDTITHDFCGTLLDLEFATVIDALSGNNNTKYTIKTDIYSVRRFLDFYMQKSSLDSQLHCEYEDELDLPKSITNELFTIVLDNDSIELVYIDDYEELDDRNVIFSFVHV